MTIIPRTVGKEDRIKEVNQVPGILRKRGILRPIIQITASKGPVMKRLIPIIRGTSSSQEKGNHSWIKEFLLSISEYSSLALLLGQGLQEPWEALPGPLAWSRSCGKVRRWRENNFLRVSTLKDENRGTSVGWVPFLCSQHLNLLGKDGFNPRRGIFYEASPSNNVRYLVGVTIP